MKQHFDGLCFYSKHAAPGGIKELGSSCFGLPHMMLWKGVSLTYYELLGMGCINPEDNQIIAKGYVSFREITV